MVVVVRFCVRRPDKTTSLYYEFSPDKTTKTMSLYLVTTILWYKFSNSNVGFVPRNWYVGTDAVTHGQTERQRDRETERQRDRETERQIHKLKTSWLLELPPKGLEARINFWRYRGFNAG